MKKLFITVGVTLGLSLTPLLADSLSNSLNGMLHQKKHDTSGMVNLNGVSLNGKPKRHKVARRVFKGRSGKTVIGHYNDGKAVHKSEADKYIRKVTKGKIKDLDMLPKKQRLLVLSDLQKMYEMKHFKSRPETAVIATVDGKPIYKKEANALLKKVTAGKIKDFDKLDKKQQAMLVEDLARPIVLHEAIANDISSEERDEVFKQMWLEKKRATIKVTPDEMLALYENKKAQTLATNPQAQIPPYISLGEQLKSEIIKQKIISNITKDMNISINYDSNESSENLDRIPTIKEKE